MRIAVIGAGYVGLVSAACFAEIGHEVLLVDSDEAKIRGLRRGILPIYEQFLPELFTRHNGFRLQTSTSVKEAARLAEVIFITVGTPQSANGDADLSDVEAVAGQIALAIESPKLVVEKSTVPVSTCEQIRRILLRSGARPELFSVASNPEFLREGTGVLDFLYPDRIVLGVEDESSTRILQQVYQPLTSGEYSRQEDSLRAEGLRRGSARVIVVTPKSAELIKHASNAFLAMKISFINAVANIAERAGADISEVATGIGTDARIGEDFLKAGIGYGGSCFPKDVSAFHAVAAQSGYDFGLLREVMKVNTEQRSRFLQKVRSAVRGLHGKRLAVLGTAFKEGTDDIRESPAMAIVGELIAEGATVRLFDPVAMPKTREVLGDRVEYACDSYNAASECDALLILTGWKEFAQLELGRLRRIMKAAVVVDGRNLYPPRAMVEAGFAYYSVGRADVLPHPSAARETKVVPMPKPLPRDRRMAIPGD